MGKICNTCQVEKDESLFYKEKRVKSGLSGSCKECNDKSSRQWAENNRPYRRKKIKEWFEKNPNYLKEYNKEYKAVRRKRRKIDPRRYMLHKSKERAKEKGFEHNLSLEDIIIPEFCPVLGIPIFVCDKKQGVNSPSIDRIDNNKGYTKDNTIVVSWRANDLKRTSTIEELEKIVKFYKNLQNLDFYNKKFNDIIVQKPWGFEYLIYANKDVAVWALFIKKGHSTSMHCHSEKVTGLVCINGDITVKFLADENNLKPLNKVMIRNRLFHSTFANEDSVFLEIETPNKKEDLLRLNDNYGRENTPYEDEKFYRKKHGNCLWIDNPAKNESKEYDFEGTKLLVEHVTDINVLNKKLDKDLIMLLSGGICREKDGKVLMATQPGDVGYGKIMKQVTTQMNSLLPNTIILTIKK